jgi:hypothetical protein
MKVAGKSGDHLRRNVVEEAGRHIERAVGGPAVALVLPPEPHDSWVVGDAPYVSLHLLGAAKYAK